MKYLRYRGEFLSIHDNVWRVEIWEENDSPYVVKDLDFDYEQPVVIEWAEKAKEEVICSSTATLHVISPSDRTYEDLYTIAAGSIRADIYCDNVLYWSGSIDTEFYEEPYEKGENYTVELTFSDFGILKRLKCDLDGMMSLRDIITHCIGKTAIKTGILDTTMISTSLHEGGKTTDLRDIEVSAANFYDEDDEAMALDEVLEGVLQPLGMKITQRNGRIYVYDLNGLYNSPSSEMVEWNGDSQTMSTDKVYNEVRITWSPYVRDGNQWNDECWDSHIKTDANLTALNALSGKIKGDATYYTWHASKDIFKWMKEDDPGFTMWVSDKGKGMTLKNKSLKFFKIIPQLDGAKDEGIALTFVSWATNNDTFTHTDYSWKGIGWANLAGVASGAKNIIMEGDKTYLPPLLHDDSLILRIKLSTLLDPRINFYEAAEKSNIGVDEKGRMNNCKKWANYLYIPVVINFRPVDSAHVYVWTNRPIVERDRKNPVTDIKETYGAWVERDSFSEMTQQWGWLAYYNPEDRAEGSAINDWKVNRPAINPHTAELTSVLLKTEGGQYIPYPTFGGKGGDIWIEICSGWIIADGNADLVRELPTSNRDIWKVNLWTLMKMPELEIMNNVQFEAELDTDDVEYTGTLNESAKDALELDTICGTSTEGIPTARGAFYDAESSQQITHLTRAGRTSTAEDLLIGTLHSQYADRHVMLSGEAERLGGGLKTFTEQNQLFKKLICVSDVQDVRNETSEITLIELRPDEYEEI